MDKHIPFYERALAAIKLRRYELAADLLVQGMEQDPNDEHLHLLMSIVLLQMEQPKEAQKFASTAISMNPENPDAYRRLGWAILSDSNFDPKRQTWPGIEQFQSNDLFEQQLEAADQLLQRAQEIDPTDPDNHSFRSEIFLIRKKYKDALRSALAGLALDPNDSRCRHNHLRSLRLDGQTKRAIDQALEYLRDDPMNDHLHQQLCVAYVAYGQIEPAILHGRTALKIDPTDRENKRAYWDSVLARNPVLRPFIRLQLYASRFRWITESSNGLYMLLGLALVAAMLINWLTNFNAITIVLLGLGGAIALISAERPVTDLMDLVLLKDPKYRAVLDQSTILKRLFKSLGFFYIAFLFIAFLVFQDWVVPAISFAALLWLAQVASAVATNNKFERAYFVFAIFLTAGLCIYGIHGIIDSVDVRPRPKRYLFALLGFFTISLLGPVLIFREALDLSPAD